HALPTPRLYTLSLHDALPISRTHVWHPCTQMKDHEWLPLVPIKEAEGVWLTDYEGKRYLDAISSWWTNLFGHRHPHIVASLKDRSEEHTSELQSQSNLVCRLL